MSEKIIILSLHKVGTFATSNFFKKMNYTTFHYEFEDKDYSQLEKSFKPVILEYVKALEKKYEVLSDIPINVMYEYFEKKYPHARFILFERDKKDWIRSVRKHYYQKNNSDSDYQYIKFNNIDRIQYSRYIKDLPKSINFISNEELENMHKKHSEDIKEYFCNKEEKLLVLDLYDEKKAEKIIKFLDIRPRVEFLKENVTHWGVKDKQFFDTIN
jgi:hypothetical protein